MHTCVQVSRLRNISVGMCWVVVMMATCPGNVSAIGCNGGLPDSMLRVAVTHPAVSSLLQRCAHVNLTCAQSSCLKQLLWLTSFHGNMQWMQPSQRVHMFEDAR